MKTSALSLSVSLSIASWPAAALAAPGKAAVEPPPQAVALQQSFRAVAEAARPAVVAVHTVQTASEDELGGGQEYFFGNPFEEFFDEERPRRPGRGPRRFKTEGMGSGFVTDAKGYVLTNEHVVAGADEIKVTFVEPEERTYKAKVVGRDAYSDLAVLKIEPKHELAYLELADTADVRVGDWAIAVGSPFGLEQTLTVGVVSAVKQSLRIEGRRYTDFIQTDAAINRGNSGGPLLDLAGRVMGVNTAIYAPTGTFAGVGFAIPAAQARRIMRELIEKGRVVRGWLGVEVRELDEVLKSQFKVEKGALVNRVLEDSPAEAAGLKRGDVIVRFDGKPISGPDDLVSTVTDTPPDRSVRVELVRGGKPKALQLQTGERPTRVAEDDEQGEEDESSEAPKGRDWLGAGLADADRALKRRYEAPLDAEGVLVVSLDPESEAAELGLRRGDLIVALNRTPTPTLQAFFGAAGSADLKEGVVLDVNRGGEEIYLSYKNED